MLYLQLVKLDNKKITVAFKSVPEAEISSILVLNIRFYGKHQILHIP